MPRHLVNESANEMLGALQEALDLVDQGVVLLDPQMRLRFANRMFADLLGVALEQLGINPRLCDLLDVACEARLQASADVLTTCQLPRGRQILISSHRTSGDCRILICAEFDSPAIEEEERHDSPEELQQLNTELRFNKEVLEEQASHLAALAEESDANARRAEEAKCRLEQEIAERSRLEAELRRLATTDPLTGALNRRRFYELAQARMVRARERKRGLGFLMIDIDHFKSINDRYGHLVGDAVLRKLVVLLRDSLRSADLIGRLGGEEFAIVLAGAPFQKVLQVAERLRSVAATTLLDHGSARIGITISIGMAMAHDADNSVEQLVARADEQLYAAKNSGRDRVCHAEPPLAKVIQVCG